MKLSTRSRYGLRLIVYLGWKYGNGAVGLNQIAKNENISEKYLEQIVPYLKTADFIESVRGNNGGYKLKRDPRKISLKEIITSLEGNIRLVDCENKNNSSCELRDMCPTREIWNNLDFIISDYLSSIKLSELVYTYKKKHLNTGHNSLMYHI